jgi:hypothetical protein
MPTVAQLLDRIIKVTNYTDRFFMIDLMNDALNQLVDGARLDGTSSISVTSGTASYTLPTDFKAPIALIDGSLSEPDIVYPLINVSETRFGYAVFGGNVIIKPEPQEDKTLILAYYKYATELSDDEDVPEIDSQWHDLLSTYTTGMIHMIPDRNVDKGTVDRYMGRWDEGKKNFIESMTRRNKRSSVREKVMW